MSETRQVSTQQVISPVTLSPAPCLIDTQQSIKNKDARKGQTI